MTIARVHVACGHPMCSPTRASLLTGLNHHLAGVGTVCHMEPGFPGYAASIRSDAVTMAVVAADVGVVHRCHLMHNLVMRGVMNGLMHGVMH